MLLPPAQPVEWSPARAAPAGYQIHTHEDIHTYFRTRATHTCGIALPIYIGCNPIIECGGVSESRGNAKIGYIHVRVWPWFHPGIVWAADNKFKLYFHWVAPPPRPPKIVGLRPP